MWSITVDHIDDGEAVGMGEGKLGKNPHKLERFKLFDDDDELYYEGVARDLETGFEPLDWAEYNAGCTKIKYLEDGKWVTL